jgi:hypothetical protein
MLLGALPNKSRLPKNSLRLPKNQFDANGERLGKRQILELDA